MKKDDFQRLAWKIKWSKKLVYKTLSYLAAPKKLHRHDDRYFAVLAAPVSKSQGALPTNTKRKLSAAGLAAIRAGAKKRRADKRAADRKGA